MARRRNRLRLRQAWQHTARLRRRRADLGLLQEAPAPLTPRVDGDSARGSAVLQQPEPRGRAWRPSEHVPRLLVGGVLDLSDLRNSAARLRAEHRAARYTRRDPPGFTAENWWRRRESNPRPKALPFPATTCLSRDLSSSGGSSTGPLPAGPSPNESRPPPSERHGGPADFSDGTCRRHRLGSGVPRA